MKENSLISIQQYVKFINQVLDYMQEAICLIDKEWKILKYNQSFLSKFPNTQEFSNFWEICDKDKMPENYSRALHKAMKNNELQNDNFFCPDNQKWFHYTIYPFELGIVLILRDITETKEKEETLKTSQYLLKAILDSTTDSNFLVSRTGEILCFNKAAKENIKKLFGKEITEGQNFFQEYSLPTTKEILRQNFIDALNGNPVETERLLSFPNGEQIWVHLRIFPVFDEKGEVWAIALNYTNIQELKSQYQKLEEIARLQSHSIRRPLSSILGLIDILDLEGVSTENKQIIQLLKLSAQELDNVIHEIIYKTY
ncbi:MAG: PAS domain S-box protein [Raineya sp.]|nr:PAS domain S-box protein [Raineya sp.]MDW8295752.1 PAS domain S-box protein [Raineya sp.]